MERENIKRGQEIEKLLKVYENILSAITLADKYLDISPTTYVKFTFIRDKSPGLFDAIKVLIKSRLKEIIKELEDELSLL